MALMGVGGGELGAAMGEVRRVHNELVLCRPFLSLTKGDLLLSLSLTGHTDFVRDQCDEARQGMRALFRHEVMPVLQQYSPTVHARLEHFSRAQSLQHGCVETLAQSLISWHEHYATVSLEEEPSAALICVSAVANY